MHQELEVSDQTAASMTARAALKSFLLLASTFADLLSPV